MKFRARVARVGVSVLLSACQALVRLSKTAVFVLDPNSWKLAALSDAVDSPRGFLELDTHALCLDHRIESQSDNCIVFELQLDLFIKALTSVKQSSSVVFKLTKRGNNSCLGIESRGEENAVAVDVLHALPIRLIKANDLSFLAPPNISPPTVAVTLPRGKLLRTVFDRMSKMSRVIELEVRQSGRMCVRVTTPFVSIKSFCHGLSPLYIGDLTQEHNSMNIASVALQSKRFADVIDYHTSGNWEASLYITPHEAVVLSVQLDPVDLGLLTYYIPVLLEDNDMNEE